tara:strand:- start:215 stop:790 length:576 start_codon:yes stop_codon:yes gene_type:complete
MNDISFLKKKQREESISKRKKLIKHSFKFNSEEINKLFDKKLKSIKIISSFFSIKTEIPTADLNKYLISKNKILTFPSINTLENILTFREFKINQNLIKGHFNIPEPPKKNHTLLPELIFVPCLAFDNNGYRLGYGGGYYDRTFAFFKSINHNFVTIGFAYDEQMVENIVRDNFDYKLNYVLTEKRLYTFL